MALLGKSKSKNDLKTSQGLLTFAARDPELLKKMSKVVNKPKEDPDVIFSGGLISDLFDGLNALQYGVVGMVKGKSFSEGVKTRESFSKKDALGQYGIPGMIAGTVLDIALDPLTYVGGFGIGKRIFSGLSKLAPVAVKGIRSLPMGSKAVDFLGNKFIYRFGQDPIYAEMMERSIKNTAIGQQNLLDIVRPLTKLDSDAQKIIAAARKAGTVDQLPIKFRKAVEPAYDELDKLGKEAVELGLLDADTYQKNVGRYLPRLYKKYEDPSAVNKLFPTRKAIRVNKERFMKREDIPQEIRESMGEILEAGYPTAKGLVQLKQSIERTKLFNKIASTFAKDEALEGLVKLPGSRGLFTTATGRKIEKLLEIKSSYKERGAIDKLIKRNAGNVRQLNLEINKLNKEGLLKSLQKEKEFVKPSSYLRRITGTTNKFLKIKKYPSPKQLINDLVDMPSYELTRIKNKIGTRETKLMPFLDEISNLSKQRESVVEKIMGAKSDINSLKLGELAGRYVPKFIADDLEYVINPPKNELIQKFVAGFKFGKVILNPAGHSRNIMSNFILNSWEGLSPARLDIYAEAGKEIATKGKWYQEARSVGLGLDTFAANELKDILVGPDSKGILGGVKRAGRKIAEMYQKEEEFAKLSQYIFQRKKGLVPDEAWKVAERATFNYAQVTPFIRRMRESVFGMPFITFTYKVTPQVVKTAIKYPTKISNIGKIKNSIENLSDREDLKRERANQPDYIRNGLFIRLPNKDKYGRNGYFDLTYIVPFGDLISGNLFETGQGETVPQSFFGKFPLFNAIRQLGENKDFYGKKIVKDSSVEPSEMGKDIFQYLLTSYAPPLMEGPIETLFMDEDAEEVGKKGLLPGRLGRSIGMEQKSTKEITDQMMTTRTVKQELLRGWLGLKVTPYNVEKEINKREAEMRKKLQQILIDEGLLKEFTIPFIPK